MPGNILIFSDGTGQAGGLMPDERISNIYKLYRAARVGPESSVNPAEQLAYYDAGLGSRPPSGGVFKTVVRMAHNFLSEATGFGLTTNIIDCYEMLIQLWRPGDRIFLFGFSRGAYTVRCLAGVLANCGIPTRLENGAAMKYDEATARRLANIAVKRVYQHAASVPRSKATPRESELMDQRLVLAHQFCETYASRQDDVSEYPYFIGVFETVAAIASRGSLLVLTLAMLASPRSSLACCGPSILRSASSWTKSPARSRTRQISSASRRPVVAVVHYRPRSVFLTVFVWYVTQQAKFAPEADPKRPWRTLTIWFGRMSFDDKTSTTMYAMPATRSRSMKTERHLRASAGAIRIDPPGKGRRRILHVRASVVRWKSLRYRRELSRMNRACRMFRWHGWRRRRGDQKGDQDRQVRSSALPGRGWDTAQ